MSDLIRRGGALACVSAVLLFVALPARADFKALKALEKQGARVSASVLRLDNGKVLQELDADARLSPASITKLVVSAAALAAWPADQTFETRVMASGTLRDGHLTGDLILTGDGDATLEHRDLWNLAARVRASGLRSVSGALVVKPPYGPLGCDTQDRCDALERSDTAYNTPLAGLAVDYGTWCVEVRPGLVNAPAEVRACGGLRLPIPVEGSIRTLAANGRESYWVERRSLDGRDVLHVGGSITQGRETELFRAMSEPAQGAGLLFRQMLMEFGVSVEQGVEVSYDPAAGLGPQIARVQGLALREQLGRMLRYSNNYVADLLTLGIARAGGAAPSTQLAEASQALTAFMTRASGAQRSPPRLYSGSGLTPENELSAADMVALLEAAYRDTRNFPAFYGGLVVPRQAPYAFLRSGSSNWQDRVALKTGTMNDPRSVCAVAGYLRRKDGGWMAFAVLVNGSDRLKRVPLHKAMEAIRSDIDDLLERS